MTDSDGDDDDDDSVARRWQDRARDAQHKQRVGAYSMDAASDLEDDDSDDYDNNNDSDPSNARDRLVVQKQRVGAYVADTSSPDDTSVTSFTSGQEEPSNPCEVSPLPGTPLYTIMDTGQTRAPDVECGSNDVDSENLVVARPVEEDDGLDEHIPEAEEYDPDRKPSRKPRTRLYYYFGCCALLVCAAAVITIGMMVSRHLEEENDDKPLHPREKLGIREQIQELVGEQHMKESPYRKALNWITFDDPLQLTPENDHLEQRFLMTYFYFATTEQDTWKSCSAPPNEATEPPVSEVNLPEIGTPSSCAFQKLSNIQDRETVYYFQRPSYRWLSDKHECSWAGVDCDDFDQVESIALGGQELNGAFPTDILLLPFLRVFDVQVNDLRGSIPSKIGTMTQLEVLNLRHNYLSGNIPEQMWEISSLADLQLGGNELQGSISTRLGQLTNLFRLILDENDLTGEIPSEIGGLSRLKLLRLNSNLLRGSIPSEFGHLTQLQEMRLWDNALSGPLPTAIESFHNLTYLDLKRNRFLTGEFPPGIWNLTMIEWIDIGNCTFSGSIGSEVGRMTTLKALHLSGNPFSGTVPPEIAQVKSLESILLEGTNIQGPMPFQVCEMETLRPPLSIRADCLGDEPEFECACCTECCRPDGTACVETSL